MLLNAWQEFSSIRRDKMNSKKKKMISFCIYVVRMNYYDLSKNVIDNIISQEYVYSTNTTGKQNGAILLGFLKFTT